MMPTPIEKQDKIQLPANLLPYFGLNLCLSPHIVPVERRELHFCDKPEITNVGIAST